MRWAFVIVCVAWIACGTVPRHPYTIEPGYEGAPELTGVFLAPINAMGSVAPELQDGRDYTFEMIKAYLDEHGKTQVETTPFRYRRAWSQATKNVEFTKPSRRRPFPPLPQPAAAKLFEQLSRYGDFDVVLMSDLVVRTAHPA
ncbi:MAG: hypothetical protein AAF430_10660 [Myxococcota bacterium]